MLGVDPQEDPFDFSGGRLCLDFTNTVDWRPSQRRTERLNSYRDLVAWSRQAGAVTDSQAKRLVELAAEHPAAAASVFDEVLRLREVIFRILSAVAAGARPALTDLDDFNSALAPALARLRVTLTEDGYRWGWLEEEEALDRMLWPVLRSAADLLTSSELTSVRQCAAESCDWLFLDMSRAQRRQWCAMKICGNRAKARRHYERKKRVEPSAPAQTSPN
jgi:predicted RNA-binding Zn ribbon-like protein